jgi:para-nitrobenzyl esterase
VPEDPYTLWQARRFNDVPILAGSNSDEGATLLGQREVTPAQFEADVRKGYGAKADVILGAYAHADNKEAYLATKQLLRDTSFGWQAYTWARLQSTNGKAKAFVYYFDRPTPATPDGTGHGIEVGYVFGNFRPRPGFTPGPDDFALSDTMQRYWINFATNGDPNGSGLPRWPAFRADAPAVMRLGDEPVPISVPNWSKLDALDDYYAWRRAGSN